MNAENTHDKGVVEPVVHMNGFTVVREFNGTKTLQQCIEDTIKHHIENNTSCI